MHPTMRTTLELAKGSALVVLGAALAASALTGCGEDPPPQVVQEAPPPPPPPPPAPTVTPIAQLMKELGISGKIRLPEDRAPATEQDRVAVLKFFDAFAKGDSAPLKAAMSEEDAQILAIMEATGSFAGATTAVERIDLSTGAVGGKPYVMAVFRSGDLFQPQLWEYKVEGEGRTISKQEFSSYVQPVDVLSRIRGDLIPEWVKLVAAERLLADEPDEVIKPPQRVQKAEAEETETGGGNSPVAAPPMRRKPPSEPIKPPDFKPGGN
jgi:hypothetical protein